MAENDLLELIKTLQATQTTQTNELRRLNIIIERLSVNQGILIEERKEYKAEYIRQLQEKETSLKGQILDCCSRVNDVEESTEDLEEWVQKAQARLSLVAAVAVLLIPLLFSLWQSGN